MTSAALVALLALAQPHLSWQAEVSAGARARNGSNDTTDPVAADVELSPAVSGVAAGGGYRAQLRYLPTFRARQPHLAFRPEQFHRATLDVEFRREGYARPFFAQSFEYGVTDVGNDTQNDFATQAPAEQPAPVDPNATGPEPTPAPAEPTAPQNPDTPVDPLAPALLQQLTTDSSAGVEVPLGRLVGITLSGGLNWGLGTGDARSRTALPVQLVPRAMARGDWRPTRFDALSAAVQGRYAFFQRRLRLCADGLPLDGFPGAADFRGGARAGEVEALLGWRRRLAEQTSFELRGGAATALNVSEPQAACPEDNTPALAPPRPVEAWPAGSLTANHRFAWRTHSLGLWGTAGASPYLDRLSTASYERLEASGGFDWQFRDWLSVTARGGVAYAVAAPEQVGQLLTTFLDGALSVRPVDWARINLFATRSVASRLDGSPRPPPARQWVVGLSLSLAGQGNL